MSDCTHYKSLVHSNSNNIYKCITCSEHFVLTEINSKSSSYCTHFKILVKVPNSSDYICIECGNLFSLETIPPEWKPPFSKLSPMIKQTMDDEVEKLRKENDNSSSYEMKK